MELKSQLRKLWDCCFNEETAFSDLYFEMRDVEQNSIFIEHNEHIVSAMQLLPYPFTFYDTIIDTAYISGACTHPEYRRKGLMNTLIIKAFEKLRKQNIPIVTLIPAQRELFAYYAKFGFVANFNYSIKQFDNQPCNKNNIIHNDLCDIETTYAYFQARLQERNCCIQHNAQDFRMIIKEMKLGGEKPIIGFRDGKIVGMAFPYTINNKRITKELIFDDEEVQQWLLSQIGATAVICNGQDQQLGMMRIVDALTIMEQYAEAHPNFSTMFHLHDDLIPENCGDYAIAKGKVIKNNGNRYEKVGIEPLTTALFGEKAQYLPLVLKGFEQQAPYMSLMLD